MNNKRKDTLSKWTKGIEYEVAFWNNVYRWKHTYEGMMGWSNYGKEIKLENFDAHAFLVASDSRKVLDVGCGMSYATGNHISLDGQLCPIDIHYVDPLASYFNAILKRHKRRLPNIEFGMMEYLSDFYPSNSVDLIVIQNALDHSSMPIRGIIESLNVIKIGGVLYLNHHVNEAETEHYKGFHQYNIMYEDGKMIVWSKDHRWDINELLQPCAEVTACYNDDTRHVVAVIKKTSDVSDVLLRNQDRKDLANILLLMCSERKSICSTLTHKLNFWKFNTIQFVVQALPWNIKMKLKKIIGQS